MNGSSKLLATLKRLNYPQAHDFQVSDFDSFISNDELSSFFENFCSLTEDNVLTPEEISEYDALTSNDIAEIEKFEQSEKLQGSVSETETAEVQHLKEKLNHVKEHCKALEKQKELFVEYNEELLEEKDKCTKMLFESEEKFKTYTWQKVPKFEAEYVSNLHTICKLTQDLGKIFAEIDDDDSMLPMSCVFKKIVENYLEKENELVEHVQQFLQSNFKYQNDMIFLQPCKDLHDKRVNELAFFQRVLKDASVTNIHIVSEVQKSAAVLNVLEQFEDKNYFQDYFSFPSQLKSKLNEVMNSNKKYEEKEKELQKFILHAVTKNTAMQCTEVAVSCAEHELNVFKYLSKIMLLVVNTLISQKGRLEFLAVCLNLFTIEVQNIVNLIEKLYNQFAAEQASFLDRTMNYEKLLNEAMSAEGTDISANALFLSMYKISANVSDLAAQDATEANLDDVLNRIKKYHEIKSILQKQPGSHLATEDSIEQYFVEAEKLFSLKNHNNEKWLEMERNLNISLNNFVMKLKGLEKKMREYQNYFDGQQKLTERKSNWNMTRYLYVFALTNQERFLKCVEEIELAVQNSEDYMPSTL